MQPLIFEAAEQVRRGQVSPVDLTEECLRNIDRQEAAVRAWVFVDGAAARRQAEALTAELQKGLYRGPLHGIPLGIKDIFDVFDWPTAAGSRLWANSVARRDSAVVRQLRAAGAVLLGKTVTTQYASFDPPPTRNPWDARRTPGGSSSGSAAAVACGMCLGSVGSQTGGSITRPASFCGAAGCKPTYGRVSLQGVVPLAASLDHPGPLAGCVRDLAMLLRALAGHEPGDPTTADRPVPDYAAGLGSAPPRIGRLRGLFEEMAGPEMLRLMDEVEARLREGGAEVSAVALPASFAEVLPRHRTVMAVEAAAFHAERLAGHPEDYGPNITGLLEEGIHCPAHHYAACKEHQKRLTAEMQACFGGVDVLLAPATRGPAPDAATTGDPAFNSPWSYTGLPVVSFPAGRSADGLPLAVQLIAPAWGEAGLFRAAVWCEGAVGLERKSPPVV